MGGERELARTERPRCYCLTNALIAGFSRRKLPMFLYITTCFPHHQSMAFPDKGSRVDSGVKAAVQNLKTYVGNN